MTERFICDDGMVYDTLTDTVVCEPCKMLNIFHKSNTDLNVLILDIINYMKGKDDGEEFADWWSKRVMSDE